MTKFYLKGDFVLNAIYVLIIHLEKSCTIKVGALGDIFFDKGFYAYVGSAQTNFHQRVNRHLSKEKRLFWHIDYLLNSQNSKINKILYKSDKKIEECNVAKIIGKFGKKISKFGSSDCDCNSHLFKIETDTFVEKGLKELTIKHNAF